ncbi:MAG: Ig-like domain repeat protein, partial [Alcanivoracaceae bacterium]|nr:Ig-like domain repeat protein [Alcanivoracaceae bacterium]
MVRAYAEINANSQLIFESQISEIVGGEQLNRDIIWQPQIEGNYSLRFVLDETDLLIETDENNNEVTIALEVLANALSNISIASNDVLISPDPGLQGQNLHIEINVHNDSNSESGQFAINIYKQNDQGAANTIIASIQNVNSIAANSSRVVQLDMVNTALNGQQQFIIVIDPDDVISEFNENDNSVFKELRILAKADAHVSSAGLQLTPSIPVLGEPIAAEISVSNLGEQDISQLTVSLYYDNSQQSNPVLIETNSIALLPAGQTQTSSFNFNYANDANIDSLIIKVDEANIIDEGDESNNQAHILVANQDQTFYVSQRYFSPNGDGIKDQTSIAFNTDTNASYQIQVLDKDYQLIKTFSDATMQNTSFGDVIWDGRNNNGIVARDGDYLIQLIDQSDQIKALTTVTLDNNKSALIKSLLEDNAYYSDLNCLGSFSGNKIIYAKDGKNLFVNGYQDNNGLVKRGIYKVKSDGSRIQTEISETFLDGKTLRSFFVLENGDLLFLTKGNASTYQFFIKQQSGGTIIELIDPTDISFNGPTVLAITADFAIINHNQNGKLSKLYFNNANAFETLQLSEEMTFVAELDGGLLLSRDANIWPFKDLYFVGFDLSSETLLASNIQTQQFPEENKTISIDKKSFLINHANQLELYTIHNNTVIKVFTDITSEINAAAISSHNEILTLNTDTSVSIKNNENFPILLTDPTFDLADFDSHIENISSVRVDLLSEQDTYLDLSTMIDSYVKQSLVDFSDYTDKRELILLLKNTMIAEFDSPVCNDLFTDCFNWPATTQGEVISVITAVKIDYNDLLDVTLSVSVINAIDFDLRFSPIQEGRSQYIKTTQGIQQHQILDRNNLDLGLIDENNLETIIVDNEFPHYYTNDTEDHPRLIPSANRVEIFNSFLITSFNSLGSCPVDPTKSAEYVYRSKDNIFADISLINNQQAIEITVTAFDRDFDRYEIHWSSAVSANQWNLLASSIESPLDEVVLNWIPSESGFYRLKLTAYDKAGNKYQDIETISINDVNTVITNINVTPNYFSPNGDGIKDQVNIDYEIVAVADVLIEILDETGLVVRSYQREYLNPPQSDLINWDGKGQNGNLLADGQYQVIVQGFKFDVYLDTLAIELQDIEMSLIRPGFSDHGYSYISLLSYPESEVTFRLNSIDDSFSHTFQFYNDLLAQWQDVVPLPIYLHSDNLVDKINGNYRLKITDKAGNIGLSIITVPTAKFRKAELLKIGNNNQIFSYEFLNNPDPVEVNYPNPTDTPDLVDWSTGSKVAYVLQVLDYQDIESIRFTTRFIDNSQNEVLDSKLVNALPPTLARPYKAEDYIAANNNGNALFDIAIDGTQLPILLIALNQNDFPETDSIIEVSFEIKLASQLETETVNSQVQFQLASTQEGVLNLMSFQFDEGLDVSLLGENAQRAYDKIINTIPQNKDLEYYWLYQSNNVVMNNDSLIETNSQANTVLSTNLYSPDFIDSDTDYISRLYILTPNPCKMSKDLIWTATGEDGEIFESNSLHNSNDFCLQADLGIQFYMGEFCDNSPQNNPTIRFELTAKDIPAQSNLPFLVELYRITESGTEELIFADTNPQFTPHINNQVNYFTTVDYDTSQLTTANHHFRLIMTDIATNTVTANKVIQLDSQATSQQLTSPQANDKICASDVTTGLVNIDLSAEVSSRSSYAAQVQVIVNGINNNLNEINYQGFNDFSLLDKTSVNLQLNTEIISPQYNGPATLVLETFNASGTSYCSTVNINVDALVDLSLIDPVLTGNEGRNINIFSPNADGSKDSFRLAGIEANEALDIDIILFNSNNPNQALGSVMSRSLLVNEIDEFVWDGRLNGLVVADGQYTLAINITDMCGLTELIKIPVTVDTIAPVSSFITPVDAGSLSAIQRVSINIQEKNLLKASATISAELEERITVEFMHNNIWNQLQLIALNIDPQTLLYELQLDWNLSNLPAGIYPLQITVEDMAGNSAITQINPELLAAQDIFWNFMLSPLFISPNADNIKDSANIDFGLNVESIVSLSVIDSNQNIVTTLLDNQIFAAGSQHITFNGMVANIALADGTYNLMIRASEVANVSNTSTLDLSLSIDNLAPQIQWLNPANAVIKGQGLAQILLQEPYLSFVKVYNQPLSPPGSINNVLSGSQTGTLDLFELNSLNQQQYQLSAEAQDQAGNTTTATINYIIDNTAPQIELATPANDAYVGGLDGLVKITGSIDDENFAHYQLAIAELADPPIWQIINTDTELTDGQIDFSWLATANDGQYLLQLSAYDQAGWLTQSQINMTLDKTAPQAQISLPVNNARVGGNIQIRGIANDNNFDFYTLAYKHSSTELWHLFHTSQTAVTSQQLAQLPTDLSSGHYQIKLTVQDKVGLISHAQINIDLDTEPPATPINLTAEVINNNQVALQWQTVTAPDIAGYLIYRNGQQLTPQVLTQNQFLDSAVIDGQYLYQVLAVDTIGNASAPSNAINITIDTIAPSVAIFTPADGQKVNNSIEITGNAHSLSDFKEYRLYVRAASQAAPGDLLHRSPLAVVSGLLGLLDSTSLNQDTSYIIRLEATDNSNNTAVIEHNIVIDNIAPAAPINLTAQIQTQNSVLLQWSANNDLDLAGYLILMNGVVISGTGDGNLSIANAISQTSFIA